MHALGVSRIWYIMTSNKWFQKWPVLSLEILSSWWKWAMEANVWCKHNCTCLHYTPHNGLSTPSWEGAQRFWLYHWDCCWALAIIAVMNLTVMVTLECFFVFCWPPLLTLTVVDHRNRVRSMHMWYNWHSDSIVHMMSWCNVHAMIYKKYAVFEKWL